MTDNRTIARLAKDIATMRRRIASAVRKHAKLQERIQKLEEAGRIIQLHKDAELVAGEGDVWYVKSDSLNTPDAEWNYYYTVICDDHGYQCGCDDLSHIDNCKHVKALSAFSYEVYKEKMLAACKSQEDLQFQLDMQSRAAQKRETATLNGNRGFQLLRA